MRITTVRHGQTHGNVNQLTEGHKPGKLTSLGQKQAKAVGERLKKDKFDIIYCSDLQRTKDTLKPLLKYHPHTAVIYDPRIRERSYGILEGQKRHEDQWKPFPGGQFTRKPTRGESIMDVRKRARKFLAYIRQNHPDESVLVVSHSGFVRQIHSLLTKMTVSKSYATLTFANGGISVYQFEKGKWKAKLVNDHNHL